MRGHFVYLIGTGTGTGAGTTPASSGGLFTLLLIAWKFFAALLVLSTAAMAMSSMPEAVTYACLIFASQTSVAAFSCRLKAFLHAVRLQEIDYRIAQD